MNKTMERRYLPFVDWMKAAGMFLIVFGHVVGGSVNSVTPPIYPKQLGVALFMFVLGYGLSGETRPTKQVLFNRLFELYLFGLGFALLLSAATYLSRGSLALSNYLPLLLGVNVLFDNFPANPTTWYLGTYLHMLVLWAVLGRGLRVPPWVVGVSFCAEIAVRSILVLVGGNYVAYMAFSNWTTVFLAGMAAQQWAASSRSNRRSPKATLAWSLALLAFLVGWFAIVHSHVTRQSFPFMQLDGPDGWTLHTSAAVSTLYLTCSVVCYVLARDMEVPRLRSPLTAPANRGC